MDWGSIITAVFALAGTIATGYITSSKTAKQIEINQAVTETKLTSLTEEVKKHNNFAQRLPVVEEQIKTINQRLDDLERKQ